MAPRWFNNIQFGRDVTNVPLENVDIIENFKSNFAQRFKDFTFNSTGPIIEEIDDEPIHVSLLRPQSILSSSPSRPQSILPSSPSRPQSILPSSPSRPQSILPSPPSPSPSPSPSSSSSSPPSPVPFSYSSSLSSSSSSAVPAAAVALASQSASASASVSASASALASASVSASASALASASVSASASALASASVSASASALASASASASAAAPSKSPSPSLSIPTPTSAATATQGYLQETEPRRSQRKRWAPLDFARGERPIYKRIGATFEVVGFEPGFPANYNYSKAKQAIAMKQQQSKAKKRPANTIPVDPVDLRPAKKGDYLFACRKNSSLITGAIQLESGKSKPEAKTGINHVYMFLVRSGQVIIKTKDEKETISLYADENSDWIILDVGKRYSIRNCGSTTAKIAYIVSDRVDD